MNGFVQYLHVNRKRGNSEETFGVRSEKFNFRFEWSHPVPVRRSQQQPG